MRRALAEKVARDYRRDSSNVPAPVLRGALVNSDIAEEEYARLERALAEAQAIARTARDRSSRGNPDAT